MEGAGFPDAVRRTAARYVMDLGRPLVLVSGGPDSVALLRVVLDLGGEPAALHVDHGLREEAAEDADGRLGLRTVATGHTADDVAETVLMNLARGAGLRGLAGIPPVRGGIERPLIERTRHEVLAYLAHLGQPYLTDPTNLTGKYARNRIRLEVLPVLQELYPGAARNLARTASLAREDLGTLEELVEGILEPGDEEVVLPSKEISATPPALRRYAARR